MAGRTLDEVCEAIHSGLQSVVAHNRLGLALLDAASGRLVQVKTYSDRRILLDNGFAANIRGSSLERIIIDGEVRIIDDLQAHLAKRTTGWTQLIVDEGMRSSLTLPLKLDDDPIGVVFFTSVEVSAFSDAHVGFLKQIAGHLSIMIEKGRWVSDLAQSNERYRLLFEMSNDGVFVALSSETPFVTVHENLCQWLGYERDELRQLSLRDIVAPGQFSRLSDELPAVHAGGSCLFETEFRGAAGKALPVELRLAGTRHHGEPALMGFARNLSEVKALNAQLESHESLKPLVGKNTRMQEIFTLVRQVAPLPTTVLVTGESGTGKELIARAVHGLSDRRDRPLVSVNCAALNENLLESEWFGHEKGAFTGANQAREGRFELADKGTIFLDEIGELSPSTQVKLLRVLQEATFERVGASESITVDVRVIAATNRDLRKAVAEGTFREDLFYRLNVVQVELPPLRERRDDMPLLIRHFIQKFNGVMGKSVTSVSPEALERLMDFPFPGNVRHLENVIEHAFVRCQDALIIGLEHLPQELRGASDSVVDRALMSNDPLASLEAELVRKVLALYDGDTQAAARRLGISRTTMWRKMKQCERLGIVD